MNRISFLVLACIVASSLAQNGYTPQEGNLTVIPLTNGELYTGTLPATTEDLALHVTLFSIFIPQNATNATLTLSNTDSNSCTFVNFYVRDEALPCSYEEYEESNTGSVFLCADSWDPDQGVTDSYTTTVYPGYSENLYSYGVNRFMYIGVGRYEDGDYDSTCSFSILVHVNDTCDDGETGFSINDDNQICMKYENININGSSSNEIMVNNTSDQLYKFQVPINVGTLRISGWFNDSDLSFYGKNYAAPQDDENNCDQSEPQFTNSTTGMSFYVLECITPRAGDFYFWLANGDNDVFYGSFNVEFDVCINNTGGYHCMFSSLPLPLVNTVVMVPFNPNVTSYSGYTFQYYFVDFAANYNNYSTLVIDAVVSKNAEGAQIYMRRNGFPESSNQYGYEDDSEYQDVSSTSSVSYAINNFETQIPGRIYFALQCQDPAGCGFFLTFNLTSYGTTSTSGSDGTDSDDDDDSSTTWYYTTTDTTTDSPDDDDGTTTDDVTTWTTTAQTTGSTTFAVTTGSTTGNGLITTQTFTTYLPFTTNVFTTAEVSSSSAVVVSVVLLVVSLFI